MMIYVQLNEDNYVTGWGTSRLAESDIELDIQDSDPFIDDNPFVYKYQDGILVRKDSLELELAKKEKDAELNKACKASIESGFVYSFDNEEFYHFSYDQEAQINFGDAKSILVEGYIEEIPWTVTDMQGEYQRIMINKTQMQELTLAIMAHKMQNISKYRDILLPIVKQATTVEEVRNVTWG